MLHPIISALTAVQEIELAGAGKPSSHHESLAAAMDDMHPLNRSNLAILLSHTDIPSAVRKKPRQGHVRDLSDLTLGPTALYKNTDHIGSISEKDARISGLPRGDV